ncbi:glycosyltransferase family 2 protein [Pseudorhodoferax sp. Leaf274]|uniref:glycosyltransferase family 2 protein n=1 Tax=Pseudorhodoferax sp. Leaf274 TaxID=1736318 RepID=UPI000702B688|nr:glycosyltransferase family 2 protein [Pseudorhodoferax sp. Leaf274]KQP43205.1 succinoglycan biosynthesis protein exoa [Pseudorhodoferax sp. Leaf274]
MSIEAQALRVLVVIPTLNEAHGIDAVIDALAVDLPVDAQVTMVVADGGSDDGTVERVQRLQATRPWLKLMANPKRIQSAAVNLAVRTHGGGADVLVRCDAHARYPSGFIGSLLQTLERTGADEVVVPMDSSGSGCFQRAVAWVSDTRVGSGGSAHRGGRRSGYVDHGHHAAFRMASFVRAGGYDESFTHNEDAEFDCRQRRLGGRVYLDADIRLEYAPRATPARLAKQYFAYGRGRSRTVRRHPGSMRLRQLALPVHLLVLLMSLALAAWSAWALAWPLVYAGVLALTSCQTAWGRRSLCGLWAGPAAGIMHTSWAAGFLCGLAFIREAPWRADGSLPLGARREV